MSDNNTPTDRERKRERQVTGKVNPRTQTQTYISTETVYGVKEQMKTV